MTYRQDSIYFTYSIAITNYRVENALGRTWYKFRRPGDPPGDFALPPLNPSAHGGPTSNDASGEYVELTSFCFW